jgi:hypothetical protein
MATFRIWHEGSGRFPILHVEPTETVYGHGPFSADRELIEELIARCRARCLALDCPPSDGRMVDTWRLVFQAPARDLPLLKAALTAYLQEGDDQLVRRFLAHPPPLRARPRPGESWELVR